ncbi:hypothetical protein HMPREF9440_00459 [Sutterella parvirubra YIT 11816]|uniref:Uncharacterized protein n=1 Tax=Sutterella parvirubra YIT 11816 TaxID=762967 RepID=H3KCK6_9BURK|nr:hypothetical protein HMPREF9440_00459 [Sutterella parvirubra YIT 11816]
MTKRALRSGRAAGFPLAGEFVVGLSNRAQNKPIGMLMKPRENAQYFGII